MELLEWQLAWHGKHWLMTHVYCVQPVHCGHHYVVGRSCHGKVNYAKRAYRGNIRIMANPCIAEWFTGRGDCVPRNLCNSETRVFVVTFALRRYLGFAESYVRNLCIIEGYIIVRACKKKSLKTTETCIRRKRAWDTQLVSVNTVTCGTAGRGSHYGLKRNRNYGGG
jgi:hypothetical protein